MTIMRTIRYGLIATTMDYNQCDDITGELLSGVLPKMGIVRTANRVLVTAEREYWGFGLSHVYVLQLVDHLKVICDHGGQDTDTGTLLMASLEAFSIQAGFHENLLTIDPSVLPWTEHCWWKVTLTAIHKYKITVNGTVSTLKKWASNDTFIMKDFLSFYEHNESTPFLQSLNRVRLYLKLATKLDLMLACGRKANPRIHSLDITETIGLSATAYNWPTQGRPSNRSIYQIGTSHWMKFMA